MHYSIDNPKDIMLSEINKSQIRQILHNSTYRKYFK